MAKASDEIKHDYVLEEFRSILKSDKSLSEDITECDVLLQRFLHVYDNKDVQKSHDLLRLNLKIRKDAPQLFFNRDILSNESQLAAKTMQHLVVQKVAEDGQKLAICRIADFDPSNFDVIEVLKTWTMAIDAFSTIYDDDQNTLARGLNFIFDGKGFSFNIFFKVFKSFSSLRIYLNYVQEAVPFRINSIHFINCSDIVMKLFSLMRPFIKKELFESIHFHNGDSGDSFDKLYDSIPKSMLPAEYGGELGPIEDLFQQNIKFLESKRNYLMDDRKWKLIE